jgi:outer membrane lipoprotein-sorting protein
MDGIARLTTDWSRVRGCFMIALFLGSPALAQLVGSGAQPSPDAGQIIAQLVRKNQDRAASLRQYENCRHYWLDYSGLPSDKTAELVVDMQYTAPAEKKFRIVSENGAHFLVNRVLKELLENEREALDEQNQNRTALTPENYEFRLLGTDSLQGRPQYILEVTPRSKNKYLYRGRIWVDAADYAVARISAEPAKNPSFWISRTEIEHEYAKIGDFWLPAHNVSISKVRFGGTAKLKIDYLNYRIGVPKQSPSPDVCRGLSHQMQLSESH